MGIRRKPKLLIETEGWTKYNECFDGFFLFGLRVALVYFWPEEGHLSRGRFRIFGLRAGRRPCLGYFWPEERLNFEAATANMWIAQRILEIFFMDIGYDND